MNKTIERSVFEGMLFFDFNRFIPVSDKMIAIDFFYYDFGFFNSSEGILLNNEGIKSGLFDLTDRVSKDHDIQLNILKRNIVFAKGYSGIEDNEGLEEDEEISKLVYPLPNMVGVYLRRSIFLGEGAVKRLEPMEPLYYASKIIEIMQH